MLKLQCTHVVLGEGRNVSSYCLQPVGAFISTGALNDPAAHPIHSNDLKGILPEEIKNTLTQETFYKKQK